MKGSPRRHQVKPKKLKRESKTGTGPRAHSLESNIEEGHKNRTGTGFGELDKTLEAPVDGCNEDQVELGSTVDQQLNGSMESTGEMETDQTKQTNQIPEIYMKHEKAKAKQGRRKKCRRPRKEVSLALSPPVVGDQTLIAKDKLKQLGLKNQSSVKN